LVELLQGRFSKGVMDRICRPKLGLFPTPSEIKLSCSCPDWAEMCKHVAAVLYGIGARLDKEPELLFRLRGVDETELIATAGSAIPLAGPRPASAKILEGVDLAGVFGIDIASAASPGEAVPARKAKPAGKGKKKRAKKAAPTARKKAKPRKRSSEDRRP
jgi:uncharacterized Zn finger protein